MPMPRRWVTTAFTFEGYRIAANRYVMRGITVRSRNIVANIDMRYDASDVAPGVTEVRAHGTAVVIEPPPR